MINKGRKFLSDMKLYSDFLGWRENDGRYETWEEATKEVFDTHRTKYADKLKELKPYMDFAEDLYRKKRFLASQRNLQFRGDDIFKHEFRLYNCVTIYADKPSWLGNAFYLLLCGCGVGVNMMLPFSTRMPQIQSRSKGVKVYTIEDSIEGWADGAHILISSYVRENPIFPEYQGYEIKFDYSKIRAKGSRVGRRFKAPGPQGIKNAFEKIEELLESHCGTIPKDFTSILQYDIFMHLSDAVLSGGVRRSACSIICSPEDLDMVYAKSGNWRQINRQRERSNNSVGLIRNQFTEPQFLDLLKLNEGTSDIGFVFMNNIYENMNPCFEIGFTALVFDYEDQYIVQRIMASDTTLLDTGEVRTAIQACNLNEGNGAACKTAQDFYDMVKAEAITGTLQAGYTNFKHLRGENVLEDTITTTQREALLGVSIAGFMNNPKLLLDPEVLRKGAEIVLQINEEVANILGINATARGTCEKPGGNGPVVLMCAPGVTAEQSENYFRVMQLNKDTEVAKYLEIHMPYLLEEGVYSENHTDYAVFVPIENEKGTIYKDQMMGVKHLSMIKMIMENWVKPGKVESRCIIPTTNHNVSNTVIIDDYKAVTEYVYDHQDSFTAVSFISPQGDKDYNQTPNTSVSLGTDIIEKYGEASLFASGLIVDGLHAFSNNLWDACLAITDENFKLSGDRVTVFIKKDWVKRAKKFAKNYFKNDIEKMIYCLKDVHLYHKWRTINRQFKEVDFTQILTKPDYIDIDTIGAASCSGGVCTLNRI